jgi:hypothetical protein
VGVYNGIYLARQCEHIHEFSRNRGYLSGKIVFARRLFVYNCIYVIVNAGIYAGVNAGIYMNFREAVDALCASLSHEDVAKALGVSLQTVRQARLREDSDAFRAPPKNWKAATIRLAEGRASYYRRLIEKMKHSD